MRICGIDEAGRGPLLGPLVVCGLVIKEFEEEKLKQLGVRDSKLLTREKREELFDILTKDYLHHIAIADVAQIDSAVKGEHNLNLNWLEAHKTAEILDKLKPARAIVDAPSNNVIAYKNYLRNLLDNDVDLLVEHKADLNHACVGAASIIAKVTRDRWIDQKKKEIGIDFGSGYMSDPKTVAFLEKHHEAYPEIVRKSWASYKEVINKKVQQRLDGFDEFVDKNASVKEKLLVLKEQGYEEVPTKTAHEEMRLKGACTITLYKNGKVLVQGKEADKAQIEKILK